MTILIEEYQEFTPTTAKYRRDNRLFALAYLSAGLTSEAGEVAGKFKKLLRDTNGEITPQFIIDISYELGDVLWYISQWCNELGLDLEGIFEDNVEKLSGRAKRGTISGSGDSR